MNFGPSNKLDKVFFEDQSKKYGLDKIKAVKFYAVDYNSDGYTDLVVLPNYFSIPNFYKYNKKLHKFTLDKNIQFDEISEASYLLFHDFDKDGNLDLIKGVLDQKSQIQRNNLVFYRSIKKNKKIIFQKQSFPLGRVHPTSSVSLIDYNVDGKIDLFLSNWYNQDNDSIEPDQILISNNSKFNFSDKSHILMGENLFREFGIKKKKRFFNARPTFSSSTCDINQDGLPDILTSSSSGYANKLWINRYEKKKFNFIDRGNQASFSMDREGDKFKTGGGNTFVAICNDYNNDEIMDIFLGEQWSRHDGYTKDRSSILTGQRKYEVSRFLRTEYDLDDGSFTWSQADTRASWFDYNNDGLLDLLVDNSGFPPQSRLILFEQQPNHSFINVADKAGIDIVNPSGSVYIDLNKDGKLDIITSRVSLRDSKIKKKVYVFINQKNTLKNRALRIYLRGSKVNKSALGARVILKTNNETQRRWVEYSQGAQPSQNEEGVHFGIKYPQKVLGLKVVWPYRSKNTTKNLEHLFNLKDLKFSKYLEITICDDGNFKIGKRKHCKK